jgi:hypothetical protein
MGKINGKKKKKWWGKERSKEQGIKRRKRLQENNIERRIISGVSFLVLWYEKNYNGNCDAPVFHFCGCAVELEKC